MSDPLSLIRAQLGLTQDELASFLSIRRSGLAKHESRHQTLPLASVASQRLGRLEVRFWNLAPVETPPAEVSPEDRDAEIAQLETRLASRRKELQKLRDQYEAGLRLLAFADAWLADLHPDDASTRPQVANWKIKAEAMLEEVKPETIGLLARRVEALERQLAFWKKG